MKKKCILLGDDVNDFWIVNEKRINCNQKIL